MAYGYEPNGSCLTMKNGIFILSVALALLAKPVQAQVTVDWGAQNSNGLGTSGGAELPTGDSIRIGTFNLTDAQIQQNQFNVNFLNASFIEFGAAAVGDVFGVPALWAAHTTGSTDALGLNGRPIYYWAFDASTLGAATQQGIFTSSKASTISAADSICPWTSPKTICRLTWAATALRSTAFATGLPYTPGRSCAVTKRTPACAFICCTNRRSTS